MTSNQHKSTTDRIIEQMDDLIEVGDLSTKNGLRFAFTVLREAMTVVAEVEKKVILSEGAYIGVIKTTSDIATRFDEVTKKVNVMWFGYQILTWVATIFGISLIGLIWSLITGVANITFTR